MFRFLGLNTISVDTLAAGGQTTPITWSVSPELVSACRGCTSLDVRAPSAELQAWARKAQQLDASRLCDEDLRGLRARWWPNEPPA